MYTDRNFKTKKQLKEAVAERVAFLACGSTDEERHKVWACKAPGLLPRRAITVYQSNGDLTGAQVPTDGRVTLEGPHYPEPHRWYATAILQNGEVVKVS